MLLGRRSDTRKWSVIGGIPEPGEQPAASRGARGVRGDGGALRTPSGSCSSRPLEPVTYANGDVCQYMDITFRCRAVGGEARVNDDESLEVGWFAVDALPELNEFALFRIKQALTDGPTWFEPMT